MKTYRDVLNILKVNGNVYVPIFYIKGTMEWFKIDKEKYIKDWSHSNVKLDMPYPCYVEVESDGEVFIHPKIENE